MIEQDLVIPDVHSPYHDKRALSLILSVAKELKITNLIQNGDLIDLYAVSAHDRNKLRAKSLKEELDITNDVLDQLDSIKIKGRRIITLGNHEWRLDRLLMTKAPELYGLPNLKIEKLLNFHQRGWHAVQYREHIKVGKILYTHDLGFCGENALISNGRAVESSVICGHTHRAGIHYFGNATGDKHVSASFGWLGTNKGADYMANTAKNRAWQLGFGIVSREPNGVSHVQVVPIVKYKCVVNGKVYSG